MAINIVALGGSGAGKSLYLASLYRKLTPSLVIEDKNEATKLNRICGEVLDINKGEVVTIGTLGFKEWKFKWQLKCGGSDYSVGSFTYLDYAGGTINRIKEASNRGNKKTREEKDLEGEIKKSDINLIFLDGLRIIDMMRKETEELPNDSAIKLQEWQNNDIPNIIGYIQSTRCPLHIVITKWDALVHEKFGNLGNIINQLEQEIEPLKNLIDERKKVQSQPPRWIPISSLGTNIAEPTYENIVEDEYNKRIFQKMSLKKIGGNFPAAIKPEYVDIVLSYAMIDALKDKLKDFQRLNIVSKIAAGVAVDLILDLIPLKTIGKLIKTIWDLIHGFQKNENVPKPTISIENIKNRQDALVYIIGEHTRKIKEFEQEFNFTDVQDKHRSS